MTCAQVQAFIEGRPAPAFAGPSPGEVRKHLAGCAACQGVNSAASSVEFSLARLATPPPPSAMSEIVVARIARLTLPDDRRTARPPVDTRRRTPALVDGLSWIAMFLGVIGGAAALVYKLISSEAADRLVDTIGFGPNVLMDVSRDSTADLLVAVAITLYLVGLFGLGLFDWTRSRPSKESNG